MKKVKEPRVPSAKQLERQRKQDEKQLKRLEKEETRRKPTGYLAYLIFIISVVYIADEVTTQISTQMQSVVANQLFAPLVGADVAVARMSAMSYITLIAMGLALFYKPLSDRFGRKVFLVINTLGMGVGMIIISIATNIPVYFLGACFAGFFVPHDMQAVYIYESTPPKHRAKIYSCIKAVATIGMMLIPVLRGLFISDADQSGWFMVYRVPGIIAVCAAMFALFFVRESDAFVVARLRQLRMTDEEKEAARSAKEQVNAQGGIGPAVKFLFSHKQILWVTVANGLAMFGVGLTQYYETTMTYGYAQRYISQGIIIDQAKLFAIPFVTQALLLFPVGSALFQLIQGFISDKLGRKPAALIMSSSSILCFIAFFVGANLSWSPYLVGFLCGSAIGCFWSCTDIMGIIGTESVPTNLRSSMASATLFVGGPIILVGMGLLLTLINVFGDAYIGIICIVTGVVGLSIGLAILMSKVKETKGIDLATVRGDEFENTPVAVKDDEDGE